MHPEMREGALARIKPGQLIAANDDNLYCDEVGPWSEDKYRHVALYDLLFSTGMKGKWHRVYIDLYSGAGVVRVRGSNRHFKGSPLIALSVPDPFDKYILCENNHKSMAALQARVLKGFPSANVCFVEGDCNELVNEICERIPRSSPGHGVLSFCFADPFDISIPYETIRRIARHRVDFMMLLALHMDANRNEATYVSPENKKVDDFLGQSDWRGRWEGLKASKTFPRFLAEEYSKGMEGLGYLPLPFERMKQIRSEGNLPLYHLALFSKHPRAHSYWNQVLKYSSPQRALWD